MSLFDQFSRRPMVFFEQGAGPLLTLDVVVSEGHSLKSKVTQSPVESGAVISDHVVLAPETLSIRGIVSDDPITVLDTALGSLATAPSAFLGGGAVGSAATLAASAALGTLKNSLFQDSRNAQGLKPSVQAWQILEQARNNRILFTLQTGLKRYDNMVLMNLTANRTAQNAKSLDFSAEFVRAVIAVSRVVRVTAATVRPPGKGVVTPVDQGQKQATQVDAATEEKTSILFDLFGG